MMVRDCQIDFFVQKDFMVAMALQSAVAYCYFISFEEIVGIASDLALHLDIEIMNHGLMISP